MKYLKSFNESSVFDKKSKQEIKDIRSKITNSFLYLIDNYECEFEPVFGIKDSFLMDFKLLRSDNIDEFIDSLYKSIDRCKFELDTHVSMFIRSKDRNIFLYDNNNNKLEILKEFINSKSDYIIIRVIVK